jgi:hypothetical protein
MDFTIIHGIGGVGFYPVDTGSILRVADVFGVLLMAAGVSAKVAIFIGWSLILSISEGMKKHGRCSLWDRVIRIGVFRTKTAIGFSGRNISTIATCISDV